MNDSARSFVTGARRILRISIASAAVGLTVLLLEACPVDPPPAGRVTAITISGPALTVPGGTIELVANLGTEGDFSTPPRATWSSTEPQFATIDASTGLVTGVAPGSATISAEYINVNETRVSAFHSVTVMEGGVVGSTGGTVTAFGGDVVLDVPSGALTQDVDIVVELASGAPTSPRIVAGTAYLFSPSGLSFATPVTLTLTYEGNLVPGGNQPVLRIHKLVGSQWELVDDGTVQTDASTVSAPLASFSTYAVLGQGLPSATASFVDVSPAAIVAGDQTLITVTARDDADNPVAGVEVVIDVTGGGTVGSNGTGTTDLAGEVSVTFSSTVAGEKIVSATIGGVSIDDTETIAVAEGMLSPMHSTAVVPATARVGVANQVVVQARDEHGNALSTGGASVIVDVTGANPQTLAATDNADGTHTATYTPTVTGTDGFAITMNGTGIGGGPFSSTVGPGDPDASMSTATVAASVTAGDASMMSVQANDQFGNAVMSGGATVTITVTGANNAVLSGFDSGDGTYSASYTPTISGTDNIAINLNGSPVAGSPFVSTIDPAPPILIAVNLGDQQATRVGTPVGIPPSVIVTDVHNNGVPGVNVLFAITQGGGTVDPATSVATDATGVAVVNSWVLGPMAGTDNNELTATAGGVPGSPVTFTASAIPDNAQQLSVIGPVPASAQSGVPFGQAPVVRIEDANGNPVAQGGTNITASIASGPTGATLTGETATTNASGEATFNTLAIVGLVGDYALTFASAGLVSTPTTGTIALVAGPLSLVQSGATVTAGTAGNPTAVTVTLRDATGNGLTGGAHTVAVTVSGSNDATPSVTNQGDSTYTTSYTPTIAGTDQVAVTVDGNPLDNSPYASTVGPGFLDAGTSTASVPNGTAGQATDITIQARDQFANALPTGGAVVIVTVSGTNSASPTVNDPGTGIYNTSYTPTAAPGTDNVAITIDGNTLGVSPYASNVVSGPPHGPSSTATVSPPGIVGEAVDIAVQARDEFGNLVSTGGATVVVSVGGTNSATPTVTDQNDGMYTASYIPTHAPGTDNIAITLGGVSISGSPFPRAVSPGTAAQIIALGAVMQSGQVGTPVAQPPRVLVRDFFGNPVTNAEVVFDITAGQLNGSFTSPPSGNISFTAVDGTVALNSWTTGSVVEVHLLEAEVQGLGSSGDNPEEFTVSIVSLGSIGVADTTVGFRVNTGGDTDVRGVDVFNHDGRPIDVTVGTITQTGTAGTTITACFLVPNAQNFLDCETDPVSVTNASPRRLTITATATNIVFSGLRLVGTVEVASAQATNSPLSIIVDFNTVADDSLVWEPAGMLMTSSQGEFAPYDSAFATNDNPGGGGSIWLGLQGLRSPILRTSGGATLATGTGTVLVTDGACAGFVDACTPALLSFVFDNGADTLPPGVYTGEWAFRVGLDCFFFDDGEGTQAIVCSDEYDEVYPITYVVQTPPVIELSASALTSSGRIGDAEPDPIPVVVTNVGGGVLSGLVATPNTSSGGNWLTAAFEGNVTEANPTTTLNIGMSLATVTGPGTHTGTIDVSSDISGVVTQQIAVTFIVLP